MNSTSNSPLCRRWRWAACGQTGGRPGGTVRAWQGADEGCHWGPGRLTPLGPPKITPCRTCPRNAPQPHLQGGVCVNQVQAAGKAEGACAGERPRRRNGRRSRLCGSARRCKLCICRRCRRRRLLQAAAPVGAAAEAASLPAVAQQQRPGCKASGSGQLVSLATICCCYQACGWRRAWLHRWHVGAQQLPNARRVIRPAKGGGRAATREGACDQSLSWLITVAEPCHKTRQTPCHSRVSHKGCVPWGIVEQLLELATRWCCSYCGGK